MTQIEIRTEDGSCPAHVYGEGSAPSVLVYLDGIGMRPAMQTIAERIAAAGYHVLMPDVFYRMGPYTAPELPPRFRNASSLLRPTTRRHDTTLLALLAETLRRACATAHPRDMAPRSCFLSSNLTGD